ncbi:MAG: hypothetical protein ABI567_08580 [Gammaproteobacteria bacterium]
MPSLPLRSAAGLGLLAALLLAGLALGGCASLGTGSSFPTWQIDRQPDNSTAVFQGIPVHTGQIVASEQGSAQSIFLALLVSDNSPWVHTGIIAIEDGVPVVYEANGQIRPSLTGGPPTRNVGGGLRRVTLESFLGKQRFVAIYDPPPGADGERIGRFARDSLKAGLPFDSFFDRSDPSKVYCSEFTALALEAGGAAPRRSSPVNPNQSVAVVMDWLGITTPDIIPAGAVIEGATRVALISRRDTLPQVEAYFDAKAELHRRFTPDQKLGNVLHFSTFSGLTFQPEVLEFLRAANEAAAGWTDVPPDEIGKRVRALAAERLGPFDPLRLANAAHAR